jgi:hypothetical protein
LVLVTAAAAAAAAVCFQVVAGALEEGSEEGEEDVDVDNADDTNGSARPAAASGNAGAWFKVDLMLEEVRRVTPCRLHLELEAAAEWMQAHCSLEGHRTHVPLCMQQQHRNPY